MHESPTDLLSIVSTIRYTEDTEKLVKKVLQHRRKQTPGLKKTHILGEALIIGLSKMDSE